MMASYGSVTTTTSDLGMVTTTTHKPRDILTMDEPWNSSAETSTGHSNENSH